MAKTVIICGKLFDGLADKMLGPTEILIEGDTIVEVSGSVGRPGGANVLDLSDRTVSPGFIDTHVSITALFSGIFPFGHFSAWPPKAEAPLPSGCRGAQSPRIRRRATQRPCTTYRNEGRRPARMPAPLSTRGLRERRSWRYANLVFLHRFWSWFRGALCKICGVFQRARRILSPLRLPVPPRPLWSLDQILSAFAG